MADIRESTVHFFKKRYIEVLKKAKHSGATVPEVKSIALRKRGCLLTLGDVDTKVQAYIKVLSKAGTPVNVNILTKFGRFFLIIHEFCRNNQKLNHNISTEIQKCQIIRSATRGRSF